MNKPLLRSLCAATALVGAVAASGPARAESVIYACTDASGKVELSSSRTGDNCEKLLSGPDAPAAVRPASPASAAAESAKPAASQPVVVDATLPADTAATVAAPASARQALVPPPPVAQQPQNDFESRLSARRDAAIAQTNDAYMSGQPSTGANPATNRKYLMINRADYIKALGITP